MVDLKALNDAAAWSRARKEIEESIKQLLGQRIAKRSEIQMTVADEVEFPKYTRQRVNYFVDEWTRVSAWMFIPRDQEESPAILCCHQACPQGKDEPAGIKGNGRLAFAAHYAELGYVTLAPDCITAGERLPGSGRAYDCAAFYKEYAKASLLGRMLDDHQHALDVLEQERKVDPARIGVIGHGLGGTNALMLAATDGRVQACVASCGFTRFVDDPEVGRWCDPAGLNLLPRLRERVERREFDFDWEHLLAMAAPSAVLVLTALSGAPGGNPESCAEAVSQVEKLYKCFGAPRAIDHYTHEDGDQVTYEALDLADDWFERWL